MFKYWCLLATTFLALLALHQADLALVIAIFGTGAIVVTTAIQKV